MPRARITPAQREEAVNLLSSNPSLSDGEIAGIISGGGVSPSAIARIRHGLAEAYLEAHAPDSQLGNYNRLAQANVSPFHGPRYLDTAPHIVDTSPPPPPPTKPDIGEKIEEATPKTVAALAKGTERFLDKIGPSVANIVVALAQYASPDYIKPAVPSPQIAEILLMAPTRILMRHAHIQMDELSADGQDVLAFGTALGTWALEMRQNYAVYREWRQQQQPAGTNRAGVGTLRPDSYDAGSAGSGPGRGNGHHPETTPLSSYTATPRHPEAGVQQSGSPLAALFRGTQQTGDVPANAAAGPADAQRQSPGDVAYAASALGDLYAADAIGRRQRGLQ